MARAIAQETQQLEVDLNEERSRYQNLLTEHLRLEEKYDDLKEEMASLVSVTQALESQPSFQEAELETLGSSVKAALSDEIFFLWHVEGVQAWPQENRLHPQQQRVRVHLQLRVRRAGRRLPRRRSKSGYWVQMKKRAVSGFSFGGEKLCLTNVDVLQDVTRGMDTSLTLKLQKRVTELEQEKQSLRNELENKEEQFQRARARVHVTVASSPCHQRLQGHQGLSASAGLIRICR